MKNEELEKLEQAEQLIRITLSQINLTLKQHQELQAAVSIIANKAKESLKQS